MRNLVYLSPVRWADFAQRPHKFAEWHHAAHRGKVLWVEPYPSRLPRMGDLRRLARAGAALGQAIPPWMEVLAVPALPVEPLPAAHRLNSMLWSGVLRRIAKFAAEGPCELVVAKPSRLALRALQHVSFQRTVYDAMDDFPAFHAGLSARAGARIEQKIALQVDGVYASSTLLLTKFTQLGAATVLVRNACDPRSLPPEDTLAGLREDGLIGYVGTLASWFDWDLVVALALSQPDKRFRLTGPLHAPVPSGLPSNIELRPACAHPLAMREMAAFSVGLIPFQQSPLTAAVDPVKYYEYRALGVPVLSTGFGEMPLHARDDAGLLVVADAAQGPDLLRRALAYDRASMQLQTFRTENAWAARFAQAEQAGWTRPSA